MGMEWQARAVKIINLTVDMAMQWGPTTQPQMPMQRGRELLVKDSNTVPAHIFRRCGAKQHQVGRFSKAKSPH